MNWTGGSLSRSRKQNANLTVIQKKHFAKARARLLNGRPAPPRLDTSRVRGAGLSTGVPGFGTAVDRRQERQGTQLALDEYESVQPVVRQLQSLKPRYSRVSTARPRSTELQQSPQSSGHRPAGPSRSKHPSPHVSAYNQQAKAQATNGIIESATEPPALDELEAKRRQLLGSSDWMGLEKMKPVRIKFPDAEDRDLIGKRRCVKSDHYEAIPTTNQYRRPIVNAYEKLQMLRGSTNTLSSPGKISIHIGSSDRGSSVRRRGNSGSGSQRHHGARTSEEMLFDDQESAKATVHNQRSTQSSLQRSVNASDEMLFDREWSGIESEYSRESQPAEADYDGRYDLGRITHEKDGFEQGGTLFDQKSLASAPIYPVGYNARPNKIHEQSPGQVHVVYCEPERHLPNQSQSGQGQRLPYNGENVNDRSSNPLSKAHTEKKCKGRAFAQATARELANLFPVAETSQTAIHDSKECEDTNNKPEVVNQGNENHDDTPARPTQNEQPEISDISNQQEASKISVENHPTNAQTTIPAQDVPRSPAPATTSVAPVSQVREAPQQPAEAIAKEEEDEIIWRTFVFGTGDPDKDWTFDNS
ncbi:MAG: hypothetical protein Q9225_006487, partial [Loekoesia sp. 1 TL-2023]